MSAKQMVGKVEPRRLVTREDRRQARWTRERQWCFMERIAACETLWFCVWNKSGRHDTSQPLPANLWVDGLLTGMDIERWISRHKDWFVRGRWSEKRYARPIRLTDAGRAALADREPYDMEPIHGGLVEPGYVVIPLRPIKWIAKAVRATRGA